MLINLLAAFAFVSIAWLISVWLTRADIIDAFWAPGFFLVSLTAVAQSELEGYAATRIVLLCLVLTWAVRLGMHLLIRWRKEEHEDRRYAAMRAQGSQLWWLRSLATVFWLQAAILWIVSLPLQFGLMSDSMPNVILFGCGAAIWLVGFLFETVGDYQLTRFRADAENASRVLNTGLWRYTRHPNYFGDFVLWWGFFLMSVAVGAPLWTVIGPLIMSVLLMKFSGVGLLESNIRTRRPKYAEYVSSTNTFFPWFPRSSADVDIPQETTSPTDEPALPVQLQ